MITRQARVHEDDDLIIAIENSWSTDHGLGIAGWVLSKGAALEKMEICVDDTRVTASWHPRPDITAEHPNYCNEAYGFAVQIPRLVKHQAGFNIATKERQLLKTVSFDGSSPIPPQGFAEGGNLFNEFIQIVNDNQLRVLEIGSRIVSPGSTSKRLLFPNAASYTGFDYYPDDNTDVVGDAHKLSSYFGDQRFDAIFSISVFEHLAMPWIVAKEINQLLEVGGITLHATHNAWPIHEVPWDFWRFSDEALKVLFSPALGFEVIAAGYFDPARIYLDSLHAGFELLPTVPAFGGVAVLAKKVADVVPGRFNWNATVEEILGSSTHYPAPAQMQLGKPKERISNPSLSRQSIAAQPPASQEKVKQLRKKVNRLKSRLENSDSEIAALKEKIAAMESSKFWKLRTRWMQLKQILNPDSQDANTMNAVERGTECK
ncbi:MAG: methyltransferase domain-containing protein [Cyanobacteria bacterium RM1_2_2]|nr:methyltransferase domain-containing protein [Cyanobacteria bacterium RM1_2_2]